MLSRERMPEDGALNGEANAVFADGGVAVGLGESAQRIEALRGTEAAGMMGLGDLPGWTLTRAERISAGGSPIVWEVINSAGFTEV